MITDRIQLAGLDSYFLDADPANTTPTNLGGTIQAIRTRPLNKGKQLEISGIQLLIEHDDLRPFLSFQFGSQVPPQPAPLFRVSVMKEMFTGLYADPYTGSPIKIAAVFLR
jgi:hypothetical protein